MDAIAGIKKAVGIQNPLELTHRFRQFVAEHDRKELAFGLSVAVFARQGPAKRDDKFGSFPHEAPVFLDPFLRSEIERDARVNASVAEMAEQGRSVPVPRHERIEGTKIVPKSMRIDSGVLPADLRVGNIRIDRQLRR